MVSKIEFIIIRDVPERSAVILHATQIFCFFFGDEAVSGITVPADYTTFHVLLDSPNLLLRCPEVMT